MIEMGAMRIITQDGSARSVEGYIRRQQCFVYVAEGKEQRMLQAEHMLFPKT